MARRSRRHRRYPRRQHLGALGEPISGSLFLLYAGGAALLALLLSKKKTVAPLTSRPGQAGTGQTGAGQPGAGTTTPTGTQPAPAGEKPGFIADVTILEPGVLKVGGGTVVNQYGRWIATGATAKAYPEFSVEYWVDLKKRNAAGPIRDRVRLQSYEGCRGGGGTKAACADLVSINSMEYCVFVENATEPDATVIANCQGKLPNDAYIAQETIYG